MNILREQYRIDRCAFDEVHTHNCYNLPDQFEPGLTAIDIGAHIGCFCYSAQLRGMSNIIAVEADSRNFTKLEDNTINHFKPGITAIHAACWRSDNRDAFLKMSRYDASNPEANTGCGTFCDPRGGDVVVPTVSLDNLISLAKDRVDFLKLDCEGAEYPILYTCTKLDKVNRIAMEIHGRCNDLSKVSGFENSPNGMANFLKSQNFVVDVISRPGIILAQR